MNIKTIYELNGKNITTLEEFYQELNRVIPLAPWGQNLNAFNDILRGGFGAPEGGALINGFARF